MKKKLNIIRSMFVTFSIVFASTMVSYMIIDYGVFGQHNIRFGNILLICFYIVIISVLLNLFYRINKVTLITQIVVTYLTILFLIYLVGFTSGWFPRNNLHFLLISLAINVVGFIVLALVLLLRRNRESRKLNEDLAKYKEHDQNEKE